MSTTLAVQSDTRKSGRIIVAVAAGLIISLLTALLVATRWHLVHDAALIDYVVFLIRNGFAPYRVIIDNELPGTYILPLAEIRIFGPGFNGLFAWVSIEIAAVVGASVWIAGPGRRWAGVAAGCLTSLIHLSRGAGHFGQRDWDVAVFLLVSCASLIGLLRTGKYQYIAIAFLFGGIASTIKPQAILFPLAGVIYVCAFEGRSKRKSVIAAIIGLGIPILCVLLFLARYHAFGAFFFDTRRLIEYYASLAHPGIFQLVWGRVPLGDRVLMLICFGAVPLYVREKLWRSAELNIITIGVLFGVSSYLLQDKGWSYHLIPAWAFASLWLTYVIEAALRGVRTWMRGVSWALSFAMILIAPLLLTEQAVARYPMETVLHLQRDLATMGARSGEVQCLDMTLAGCVNVLYRLRITQATGFIHDFYLFPNRSTSLTAELQSRFLAAVMAHPPRLIVLSSDIWPDERFGYDEVSRWPAFESFLQEHYQLAEQYAPDPEDRNIVAGYRIYSLADRSGH